jgi:hypothetical protein
LAEVRLQWPGELVLREHEVNEEIRHAVGLDRASAALSIVRYRSKADFASTPRGCLR